MPRVHAHLDARDKQGGAKQIDIGGIMVGKKELATGLALSLSQSLKINHDAINAGILSPAGEEGLVRN
jgi:hypothetical protein